MGKSIGQHKEKYTMLHNKNEGDMLTENIDFSTLYNQTAIPLFHYLYSKVNNFEDAEDLTSQTFLTAYQNMAKLREPKKFQAWLFIIARNKVHDFYRQTKRHFNVPFDEEVNVKSSNPDRLSSEDIDRTMDLECLIASLHPREQEYLHLRIVAELPFAEIASILNKPEARIKKRYYRLLDRLQAQMEKQNDQVK